MNKFALSALSAVALSASAFAGQPVVDAKDYKAMPEPCVNDTELQVDIFGSYTDSIRGRYSDGFGGGLAVNYFFMRNLGVGVEGNLYDGDANGVWSTGGRLIARFPIDCFVPYVFAAGGVQADGATVGYYSAGGGLEYRIVPQKVGIFAEGRYTWAENTPSSQVRAGVRVVF